MKRRTLALVGVTVAVTVLVAVVALRRSPPGAEIASRPAARTTPPAAGPERSPGSVEASREEGPGVHGIPAASRGPMPRSLRETAVDGELRVDAAGHFVPGPESLRLFDYFFSASGEEPEDVIRGRIVLHALEHLPEAAAQEAIEVLDRYLGYRSAARDLADGDVAASDLGRRLQWMRELRTETLGPELAAAFYGKEEALALLDLERLEVVQDESLDADTRERLLEDIDARLEPEARAQRERAAGPTKLRDEVRALRERGATDAEVFEAREARYGEAAARRLAALDAEREDWRLRLAAYRAEREALREELEGLEPGAQEARLDALRAEFFATTELPRVRGLDRFAAP